MKERHLQVFPTSFVRGANDLFLIARSSSWFTRSCGPLDLWSVGRYHLLPLALKNYDADWVCLKPLCTRSRLGKSACEKLFLPVSCHQLSRQSYWLAHRRSRPATRLGYCWVRRCGRRHCWGCLYDSVGRRGALYNSKWFRAWRPNYWNLIFVPHASNLLYSSRNFSEHIPCSPCHLSSLALVFN